jgi:OOP family OmpA-OmpF porin
MRNLIRRQPVNQHKQLALSIALIGASCSTMAQDSAFNPSWYIQPSVSAFRPDNDFGLDSKTTGFGGGLKFGRAISDHWDVQMGYVYGRAKDNGDRNQQHLLGQHLLKPRQQSLRQPKPSS